MRRRSHRHPYIEAAVFGAALLLAAFIARELWARRQVRPSQEAEAMAPAVLTPTRPPLPGSTVKRTVQAVTAVAPIKLSRVRRVKPKAEPVPAPK
jgi:hypothetical protein